MASWDPEQYERYRAYRVRPADDLLARLPPELSPREVWELGCGAGEQAAALAARYPDARVRGLDSSAEMLAAARARSGRVEWVQGDIAAFAPETAPDLIFTNAALQWLPHHEALFPRLVELLAPGGLFACQVPVSHGEIWHVQLRETAAQPRWAGKLADARPLQPVAAPGAYYDWVSPLAEVDIWTTTYLHALAGDDPVVEWMKGTGLRPYLDLLPEPGERAAFLDAYRARTRATFPKRADGVTLFPFPRLFILARRRG